MLRPIAALACLLGCAWSAHAAPATNTPAAQAEAKRALSKPPIVVHKQPKHADHSGRRVRGKASVYHPRFAGQRMANEQRYNPHSNNAASKILPLGTVARVTNLDNGRSSKVKVEDRGPYVDGRVVDLSSATAADLGISRKEGVAPVELAPITVPQPDGSVKLGAGAAQ
jgi:rare lipoprotein A